MQLTPHFTLEELIFSENAARLGIDNYPNATVYENLKMLATSGEFVRTLLKDNKIRTSSGYRSPALNAATPGSSKTSAHQYGLAMDFTCPAFGTPIEICRAIAASDIAFDQVIHEFGSWCHFAISTKGQVGRRELLTIDRNGTRKGLEE